MPIIRVEMLEGRTEEQKRGLAKELTAAFVRTCGGKPEAVQVMIQDVAKGHWGVGGVLMSNQ